MRPNHAPLRTDPRGTSRPWRYFARAPERQAGTSLIEFFVAAIPILLIGMGSIEISQWFFKRQALSLALLEAGRAAITAHASPRIIESAFEKALLPLFSTGAPSTESGSGATRSSATRSSATRSGATRSQYDAVQRLEQALAERRLLTGAAPWRIEILSPTRLAFLDFSDPALPIAQETGLHAINNNYLAEQSQHAMAQGWAAARGPESGQDILQANTLVLRLTYLHEPILPGIKGLMRLLGSQGGSYGQNAMARGGYLPIVQDMALVMQSHPVDWPSLSNGKVVKHQMAPSGLPTAMEDCRGLWCMDVPSIAATRAIAQPSAESALPRWPSVENSQPADTAATGVLPGNAADAPVPATTVSGPAVAADDPACGVILCCAV
ncbi:hypothetical protein CR155_10120 [Pollutimonas nitritireducens]|uniref:TadE-like domain-containing protein n=1 Tax=Pollutimonas nitritireducens TaxID=2045209 RepID=A0A2N4UFJ3_9BURK|nr:TadE/TadG family type IV pilus assembly protein [Pollutimonas nitritireducens]PLC53798.1 hypothetical protein CR155_10120 [Pollutimonas nitritireducens]